MTPTPPPDYGIIYNWDGTPHGFSEFPQSIDQLLEIIYAPIMGTQVGAMTWCVGADEARWPSDRLAMYGEFEGWHYEDVKHARRVKSVRAMYERAENPYTAIVGRGHELGLHVYAAVRMNDNHFWSNDTRTEPALTPETMGRVIRHGLTELRKSHPEWCLGVDQGPRWASTSWNMAIPDVREMKLAYIEETCRLADWDGVEIDWQRHAFHLPEADAYRLMYSLTDLQRSIRALTDRIARERGRPFYVLVRVGATAETCRRIEYDIENWTRDGLCDIIATNANSGTDPGVDIESYRQMTQGTGIKLYPGFDSHGEGGTGRLMPAKKWRESWYRGLAHGYYKRGADGIHIFNWHGTAASHRPLLTAIGSPDTLRDMTKVYTALKRIERPRSELRYGAERDDRLSGEVPVNLYRTLTGDGPRFHIVVHDDLSPGSANAELHIELDHFSPADRVAVTFDGALLGPPTITNTAANDPNNPSDVAESGWLVWKLDAAQVAEGTHEVQTVLLERDGRIKPPITVSNVEIWVTPKLQGRAAAASERTRQ